MKKLIAFLLTAALVLSLAACTSNPAADPTEGATRPAQQQPTQEATVPDEGAYSLTFEGVELVPGAPFDPAVLPEAAGIFEVPSCAIEGTDNVYNYNTMEVTAYDDGTGEVIYSIYLVDPNLSTDEGLYMGDDLARVTELYGTDYAEGEGELVFTKGATTLRLIMDGETVISIEYRMAD